MSKEQNFHSHGEKMKTLLMSLVVILTLAFFEMSPINAQTKESKDKTPKKGMMRHHEEFFKKLKLTDAQKEKIAQLKIDFRKKMVDLQADLKKSKLALGELRLKDDLKRDDVLSAVDNISKCKAAIATAFTNHLMDVYELLTPEQQKIARQEAMKFFAMDRFDKMGHGPMGHRRMGHKPMMHGDDE
jgi:Spy/CpxP family protein refolding chaperone